MSSDGGKKIKKGSLLLLTRGEYSDYDVTAVGRALETFDPEDLRQEWYGLHPGDREQCSADLSAFVAWLINAKGLIEELEHVELHVGSYANLEPSVRGGK